MLRQHGFRVDCARIVHCDMPEYSYAIHVKEVP